MRGRAGGAEERGGAVSARRAGAARGGGRSRAGDAKRTAKTAGGCGQRNAPARGWGCGDKLVAYATGWLFRLSTVWASRSIVLSTSQPMAFSSLPSAFQYAS